MKIYSTESLEALSKKCDLVAVISHYLKLRKSGACYLARCPFHIQDDETFILSEGGKFYHCYGCSSHGDAVAFLMNHLKLDFYEAVERLAFKFDVILEECKKVQAPRRNREESLREAMRLLDLAQEIVRGPANKVGETPSCSGSEF